MHARHMMYPTSKDPEYVDVYHLLVRFCWVVVIGPQHRVSIVITAQQ